MLETLTYCARPWMQDARAFVRPHSFYLLHFQPGNASPFLIDDRILQFGLNFIPPHPQFYTKAKSIYLY